MAMAWPSAGSGAQSKAIRRTIRQRINDTIGDMLREKVIKGGLLLSIRSVAVMALSFLTMLALARLISPEGFGTYALIQSITTFVSAIGTLSVKTYLVRLDHEPSPSDLRASFSLLVWVGLINAVVSLAIVGFLDWRIPRGLIGLALIGLGSVSMTMLSCVPLALLERALDYKRVSLLDVISKGINSAVSLGLAFMGYGVAALLLGELFSSLFVAALLFYFRPVRLHVDSTPQSLQSLGAYVSSFSVVALLWSLHSVGTASLLAGLVSLEALGYVKIAQSLHNRLAFLQDIILRISMSALAKVTNRAKLVELIAESSFYSFLLTTPLYFLLAGTGYWIIPWLFGPRWAPAAPVYLIWALAAAILTVFTPLENLFIVKGYNTVVIKFRLAMLLLTGLTLVPAARAFGPLGMPLAELAGGVCFFYLYAKFKEIFGAVALKRTAILLAVAYALCLVAYCMDNILYSATFLVVTYAILLLCSRDLRRLLTDAIRIAF